MSELKFRVVEIFQSIQGEGFNLGMPSIFIRLGKCNLACSWCDTEYEKFHFLTLGEIMTKVKRLTPNNIILTGGEPTIQPHLQELVTSLKDAGYYVAMETNGLKKIPERIDYVAVSPKRAYAYIYAKMAPFRAHEVRVVVDGEVTEFCHFIERLIVADNYYLSPCEEKGEMNFDETVEALGALNARRVAPPWRLSLQAHKFIGIP